MNNFKKRYTSRYNLHFRFKCVLDNPDSHGRYCANAKMHSLQMNVNKVNQIIRIYIISSTISTKLGALQSGRADRFVLNFTRNLYFSYFFTPASLPNLAI